MLHPAPQLPDSQKTQARSQRSGASNGAFTSQCPLHSSRQQPELDKQQHNHKGRHQREDGVVLLTQGGRGVRNAECGMRNAECQSSQPPSMRNAECGMRSAECGMQSAECQSSYTSTAVAQISSPLHVSMMRGSGRLGGPARARPSSTAKRPSWQGQYNCWSAA